MASCLSYGNSSFSMNDEQREQKAVIYIELSAQSYRKLFHICYHPSAVSEIERLHSCCQRAMLLVCLQRVRRVLAPVLLSLNSLSHFWLVYWVCKLTKGRQNRRCSVCTVQPKELLAHIDVLCRACGKHGSIRVDPRGSRSRRIPFFSARFCAKCNFTCFHFWKFQRWTNECFGTFVWCNLLNEVQCK